MDDARDAMSTSSACALRIEDEQTALDPAFAPQPEYSAASTPDGRLRTMLRRMVAAFVARYERRASQQAMHYLRTRKELSQDYRNELERRFMGQ